MADIQSKILNKYGIDIAGENIFKLYKIDSIDISPQELEMKIQEAHKRWTSSINGANEKNAERDRARLEKADKYEAILKDAKLSKEVFRFYTKSSGTAGGETKPGDSSTQFAGEYFKLVATTKKLTKADVDFFFKYYQAERKNKKAILEMLSKEMKVSGLGKEEQYADEVNSADPEGKKKDGSGPLVVNLFQEATILKLARVFEKFEQASQNSEVCMQYPAICYGLYDFLKINDVQDANQFKALMTGRGKEVFAVRQEKGAEFVPLVDLFNLLLSLGDYRDVADNIPEFKLLLKYPNLTPYMFAFVEMKKSTLKGIVTIANREYAVRNETDFILNYYKPIHDNFGISDSSITAILRKAEQRTRQNDILNMLEQKLGLNKNRRIPISVEIIHWLVYWPVFSVYFVFEISKFLFTKLHRLAIPVSLLIFGLQNWLLPKYGIVNLLVFRKIIFKNQWLAVLDDFLNESGNNAVESILLSMVMIIILLAIYLIPPLVTFLFLSEFADDFNKRFDWVGIERTFRWIFQILRRRTEDEYRVQKKLFLKNNTGKIVINLVCAGLFIILMVLTPAGPRKLSEITGYFHK